jgi:hypothetical protein
MGLLLEEFGAGSKGFSGIGSGNAPLGEDLVVFIGHSTDKLSAATFNSSKKRLNHQQPPG